MTPAKTDRRSKIGKKEYNDSGWQREAAGMRVILKEHLGGEALEKEAFLLTS